jgi:hypothetical protein
MKSLPFTPSQEFPAPLPYRAPKLDSKVQHKAPSEGEVCEWNHYHPGSKERFHYNTAGARPSLVLR